MKIYGTPFSIDHSTLIRSLKQSFEKEVGHTSFDEFFIDEDGGLYYYTDDFRGRRYDKEFVTRENKYIELFKAIKTLDKYIY